MFGIKNNVLCISQNLPFDSQCCRYSHAGTTGSYWRPNSGLAVNFLKGAGVPCPGLFAHAQAHFNNIDMDLINGHSYQPRMLCYATTGSYDLECEDLRLSVRFVQVSGRFQDSLQEITQLGWVEDHAPQYLSGSGTSGCILAAQGKISFRTCFQKALLPLSYVLTLASAAYPDPGGEPKTFRDAVDHWLFCEILSAIGSHSMM